MRQGKGMRRHWLAVPLLALGLAMFRRKELAIYSGQGG